LPFMEARLVLHLLRHILVRFPHFNCFFA
jgi:hypothetical protein